MDIHFTPEELAFRSEVRAFLGQNLPADLAEKVRLGRRLAKEEGLVGRQLAGRAWRYRLVRGAEAHF